MALSLKSGAPPSVGPALVGLRHPAPQRRSVVRRSGSEKLDLERVAKIEEEINRQVGS